MTKSKLYLFGLVSMMLINFVLIGFLWMGAKHQGPPPQGMDGGVSGKHHGPEEMISKKLNFSEAQKEDYKALILVHQEMVFAKEKEIAMAKKELYKALKNSDYNTDSALNIIGQKQIEIEKTHLQHFKDIKNICQEDQLKAYEELLEELGRLFNVKRKR